MGKVFKALFITVSSDSKSDTPCLHEWKSKLWYVHTKDNLHRKKKKRIKY